MTKDLMCPQCHSRDTLATLELLTGLANVTYTREDDGSVATHWGGSTDVNWNSSETVGLTCRNCQWTVKGDDFQDDLVEFIDESDCAHEKRRVGDDSQYFIALTAANG